MATCDDRQPEVEQPKEQAKELAKELAILLMCLSRSAKTNLSFTVVADPF